MVVLACRIGAPSRANVLSVIDPCRYDVGVALSDDMARAFARCPPFRATRDIADLDAAIDARRQAVSVP
jgi:hypothetical protein